MGQLHLKIKSRIFNPKYLRYIDCQTPVQIFYGGSSSGKSVFLSQRDVIDILKTNRNFLIIRKVANTLRDSVFAEIKKVIAQFKLTQFFHIREQDLEIVNRLKGNKFIFRGLDDAEKLKSITVPAGVITDLRIEEASEITEKDYNDISLRLRGKSKYVKRKVLSLNPTFRQHWICKRFFNGHNIDLFHNEKMLLLHSTYRDNKFLSSDDIQNIEDLKDVSPYHYMVYSKGEWGVLGNLVFSHVEIRDLSSIRDRLSNFRNGLDFGFTNDATALLHVSYDPSIETIYITDEIYGHGMDNQVIALQAKPIIGDEPVFCDSAEPKSIYELQGFGINSQTVKKGKDSVWFGLQWLMKRKIIIDCKCIHAAEEIASYQWAKNKNGETLNIPIEINDHTIAALRYALEMDMIENTPFIFTRAELEREHLAERNAA